MEIALFVFLFLFMLSLAWAWIWFAPYMPTWSKDLERITSALDLQAWDRFFEFWCGTAHVSTYIAEKYPDVEVIWIEYAFPFYVYSRCKQKLVWPSNLRIIFWNWFKQDLSWYDVIYTFWMMSEVNSRLKAKLLQEMKPWAKFLSYIFNIVDWEGWTTQHFSQTKEYSWFYMYTRS